ncbi:unnamed protein product [Vitrella brassicaformis CCMP3155]|uniref:persulfide dioxygenase n=3 Tax=Vitrella brassicaformis TaxID=1169539 RepID=A0A0G4EH25_VITBC|nr:unnamed protein product [Vitrella brassicaformis CCMP3155]|eukprot:CEL95210.1 unnamed protein product [Vitrella brassicaformis CCMP3155]
MSAVRCRLAPIASSSLPALAATSRLPLLKSTRLFSTNTTPKAVTSTVDVLGNVPTLELQKLLEGGHYRSVVNLCGPEEDYISPANLCEKYRLRYASLPVDSNKLSFGLGESLVSALSTMPHPLLVQCQSASRASAAALLHVASSPHEQPDAGSGGTAELSMSPESKGTFMSPTKALKFAEEKELPFLGKPPLKQWVERYLCARHVSLGHEDPNLFFRQLFDRESCTFTYILADPRTREGIIIDPVLEHLDRDLSLLDEYGIILKYALNTHVHADHVTSTGCMKARLDGFRSVLSSGYSSARADLHVDHDAKLFFGDRYVVARSTPGHTPGCLTFVLDDHSKAFTGDALLIRGCGRTDFQSGDSELLYRAIWTQIFTLPESCLLYPGHDYQGRECSSVWEEKRYNPRLTKSLPEFKELMANLGLPQPKLIEVAVPVNLEDGMAKIPSGELRCFGCQG